MTLKACANPDPQAVQQAVAKALVALAKQDPNLSSARPAGRTVSTLIVLCLVLALLGLLKPLNLSWISTILLGLGVLMALFRLWACLQPIAELSQPITEPKQNWKDTHIPIWTVLIALYREASSVPDLVKALMALDWPPEKLEIIFACESDDWATQHALSKCSHLLSFRVISLPPGGPRTKPRALQTALPFCQGRFVTVYDAEDRPDPAQIRAAFQAFQTGPRNLAVVQAPLVVWNASESWISRQFALDYAVWFRVVLPALNKLSGLLLLGGTSNHFKIAHLRAAGGWDPFNVTEDADLGIRLARLGFCASLIAPPTLEEGTPTLSGWVRQRGRWIQGHIQTFSLHLRQPIKLTRQLGVRGLLGFYLGLATGPLQAVIWLMAGSMTLSLSLQIGPQQAFMWHGLMWLIQVLVSAVAIQRDGRMGLWWACLTWPLYQLCQIPALFRALWRIYLSPSFWDKTNHGPEARLKRGNTPVNLPDGKQPQTG